MRITAGVLVSVALLMFLGYVADIIDRRVEKAWEDDELERLRRAREGHRG